MFMCTCLWVCVLGALERVEASNSLRTGVEIHSCELSTWVPGIELKSPAGVVQALNCLTVSPAPGNQCLREKCKSAQQLGTIIGQITWQFGPRVRIQVSSSRSFFNHSWMPVAEWQTQE